MLGNVIMVLGTYLLFQYLDTSGGFMVHIPLRGVRIYHPENPSTQYGSTLAPTTILSMEFRTRNLKSCIWIV